MSQAAYPWRRIDGLRCDSPPQLGGDEVLGIWALAAVCALLAAILALPATLAHGSSLQFTRSFRDYQHVTVSPTCS